MNVLSKIILFAIAFCVAAPSMTLALSGGFGGGAGAHSGVGVGYLAYFGGVASAHLGFDVTRQFGVRSSVTWMIFPEADSQFNTGPMPPGFGTVAGERGSVQLVSAVLGAQATIAGLNNGYVVVGPGLYHALEFPGYSGTRFGLMGGVGAGLKTTGPFRVYFEAQVNVVDWPGGPMILMPIQLSLSF